MWLIRLSVRNPYVVAAFALVLAILGVLSLRQIPVDILPVFKSPAVQVLTYYPGMPASSIEKTITNRIERWVNQAPGARLVESRSVPGVSVVKVYFRDDIDPNEALTLTNSLALGALPNLPPNTLPPVALPTSHIPEHARTSSHWKQRKCTAARVAMLCSPVVMSCTWLYE
jgi:multidrug efflux pump subunit AcrB